MDSVQLKSQYQAGERNFCGALLSGANLVWFDLRGIDLRGADLSYAKLSGANLSEANLSSKTNLAFADLSRADLSNSNLKETNLEGANLEGVQLNGALYDERTKFPFGFNPLNAGAVASGQLNATMRPDASEVEPNSINHPSKQEDTIQHERPMHLDMWASSFKQAPTKSSESTQLKTNTPPSVKPSVPSKRVEQIPSSQINYSGLKHSNATPQEISGWNWGAFLMPWFWIFSNKVWHGLWIWIIPIIPGFGLFGMIIFGIKGNEWAWKSRSWKSIETFKSHQRLWAIIGWVFWGFSIYMQLKSK
ncbi:MAG TPA: pentapeptide repeat-containing protein [Stenomitos sp.]